MPATWPFRNEIFSGNGLGAMWRDTVSNVTVLFTNSSSGTSAIFISANGRYVEYSDTSSHPWIWDSVAGTNIFSTNAAFTVLGFSPTARS